MNELFSLQGRVALVTGAAMGIGREIAQAFLEMGACVAITSRTLDRAKTAAAELAKQTGGEILPLAMNVRDEKNVAMAFKQLEEKWQRLDVLVNNAGGAPQSDNYNVWNRKLEDWNYVIETNLTGTFLCTRQAAQLMMPRRSGAIINIASIAALVGRDRRMYEGLPMRPNLVDYAACKAGILGFTRDAAAELAPWNIRVNAISPGGVERGQPAEFIARYSRSTALGRMAREGMDMKGAAVFLAGDAAAYITGQNIVIDGGFVCYK